MKRRALLLTFGAGIVGGAGCLSANSTSSNTTGTETNTQPTTVTNTQTKAAADPNSMKPFSAIVDVGDITYGRSDGFRLKVRPEEVEVGDELTVSLEHFGDDTGDTAPKDRYLIQKQEQDQWTDLFRLEESVVWTAEAIGHLPSSGGFTWEFDASESGFSKDYFVSSAVEPGLYRFVFWGMIESQSLAVRFEIV